MLSPLKNISHTKISMFLKISVMNSENSGNSKDNMIVMFEFDVIEKVNGHANNRNTVFNLSGLLQIWWLLA